MTVFVAISTPNNANAPDSSPRRIVAGFPEIQINVVQFEQSGTKAVPYIQVQGVPTSDFHRILESDPRLSDPVLLETTDNGDLFKVVWDVDSPVVYCVEGASGTIIEANGDQQAWRLKLWFENSEEASTFHQCCTDHDVPLEIKSFVPADGMLLEEEIRLTDRQAEILRLAYHEGYFDEPRSVSQEELADELGISPPAVSKVFRRGVRNLIESQLID